MSQPLSPRRREALRLDLEDQQKALIEEAYRLSQGLIKAPSAPDSFRNRMLGEIDDIVPGSPAIAQQLERHTARLRAINLAQSRIAEPAFGQCHACGVMIAFSDLAEDPARNSCPACTPPTG